MIDTLGLEITPCKPESLEAINRCILKDLNYEDTPPNSFKEIYENDSECPMLKILYVYLNMLIESPDTKNLANTLLPNISS